MNLFIDIFVLTFCRLENNSVCNDSHRFILHTRAEIVNHWKCQIDVIDASKCQNSPVASQHCSKSRTRIFRSHNAPFEPIDDGFVELHILYDGRTDRTDEW